MNEYGPPDLAVVAEAADGDQALRLALELEPDIVLLDLQMPGTPVLQMVPLLRERLPRTAVIIVTLLDPGEYRQLALMVGASDFVSKAALKTDLLPAIQHAA